MYFVFRLIHDKEVDLVINLPNQNTKYIRDNYLIRRASIDCGVPLITNSEVRRRCIWLSVTRDFNGELMNG